MFVCFYCCSSSSSKAKTCLLFSQPSQKKENMWRPGAQRKEIMKIVYLALAPVAFACFVAHPSTEKWMIKKVCSPCSPCFPCSPPFFPKFIFSHLFFLISLPPPFPPLFLPLKKSQWYQPPDMLIEPDKKFHDVNNIHHNHDPEVHSEQK